MTKQSYSQSAIVSSSMAVRAVYMYYAYAIHTPYDKQPSLRCGSNITEGKEEEGGFALAPR